jgi:hypothetical protein
MATGTLKSKVISPRIDFYPWQYLQHTVCGRHRAENKESKSDLVVPVEKYKRIVFVPLTSLVLPFDGKNTDPRNNPLLNMFSFSQIMLGLDNLESPIRERRINNYFFRKKLIYWKQTNPAPLIRK